MQEPGSTAPKGSLPLSCSRCGRPHGPAEPCAPGGRTLAFAVDAQPPGAEPRPFDAARSAAAPEAEDPLIGARVGSFQIVRLLGRGGMGTVYLAEHPAIGSRVAVKFLHEDMASDPALVSRFYDEARAVNLVGHENIVGIYDLSVVPPSRYYFVMEYLEGATLQALLQAGPIDRRVALDVLLQTCDALHCAHECGVVHRDLKPENVFLVRRRGKSHFVKLVDFGIAKLRGAGIPGRTQAGYIIGTPEYMAPEQCDDGVIDARTDVYSLGVIAFELATGRLPFTGRTVAQLLLAHLRERPPRPSDLAAVDPRLEAAILRALEKDPAARFPDMASFAAALRGVPGTRTIVLPPAEREAAPAAEPTAPSPPEEERLPVPAPAPPALVLDVEVAVPGAAPAKLPAVELTRGGLFLHAERGLPPLRARVKLALAHPSFRAPVELEGEIVRHVSPGEAAQWRMTPGFAVQFVDPRPEARAAIAALADELRHDVAPPPSPAPAATEERLRALEGRRGEGLYAFLGVAADAEFGEIRRALRALREELDPLRARPLAPDHPARATALLVRLEAAHETLGSPAARLAYDARHGNPGGVARCIAAGVPLALVEARRRELHAERPERVAEAQRQLARAEVARKLGNAAAAAQAYEAALAADPLDLAAHEAYAALRRSAR